MKEFQGFLFSKLHLIGSKSEGPSYFLQQFDYSEIPIVKKAELWLEDPGLQNSLGTKVSIIGELSAGRLHYDEIRPYSLPQTIKEEGPSLKVGLIPETEELWLDMMPPSPPVRPFKVTLEVEWPYKCIWQGICPTSQLYDFFVEFDGKCLWQWSKDRVFMEALTPVTIQGGRPYAFTETWLIDPGAIPSEGVYSLRGIFIASGQEVEKQIQIRFAH